MKCPICAHDLIIDYKDAQLPAGVSEAKMQVAMLVGTPAVCPWQERRTGGRDPGLEVRQPHTLQHR